MPALQLQAVLGTLALRSEMVNPNRSASAQVMALVLNPRNAGRLQGATHTGCVGIPGEGRYIKVHLVLDGGRIERASYESNGCASLVCQLACGKLVKIVDAIEPNDDLLMLGGLPEGKEEMARMAVDALKSVVLPQTRSD